MGRNRILKTSIEDGIATLTIDWPDRANTMGKDFAPDCLRALDAIQANSSVRVLLLTGSGKVFCGGGDLFEIMDPEPTDIGTDHSQIQGYNDVAQRIYYFSVPVIAAVNGPAVGGGAGLALACDIAIASPRARYDIYFGRLGLSAADVGVPWLLHSLIGPARANYYVYTGGSIDAPTGKELGLFAEVVAEDTLMARALEVARTVRDAYPPTAARITRTSLLHGTRMDFRDTLAVESYLQAVAFQTPAHKESIGEYRRRISTRTKK